MAASLVARARARTGASPSSSRTRVIGVPLEIGIRDETIRLGQLLKLAGVAESGADAKLLLADELVTVNGEVETRRGRQLHPGDVIALGDASVRLT